MDKIFGPFIDTTIKTLNIQNITLADCDRVADQILKLLPGAAVTKQEIVNYITQEYNIYFQASSSMSSNDDTENWLSDFKQNGQSPTGWKFWTDYKKTMTLPGPAQVEIDLSTDKILNKMANPQKGDSWYRAGLVVGHVQSGKTGNFIGLINKSLDAGFKIVLVLTGMYDDLRTQTQMRIDKSVRGVISDPEDRNFGKKIGVGKLANHPNTLGPTSSNLHGDFKPEVCNVHGILSSSDPTILVCKKNSSILGNLLKFFASAGVVATDGYKIIKDIPLLIIDDEADSASIQVATKADEISKINGRIRAILALFAKSAYVGYTATPYANIFICPDEYKGQDHIVVNRGTYRLGKYDLFPRDFIVNLTAPNNYVGANMVFGIPTKYGDQPDPLPIITTVNDGFGKVSKKCPPTYIPDSMKDAILHFFVSTAVRRARGQKTAHSSMLINVAQYTNWQDEIGKMVQTYVVDICNKIGLPSLNRQLFQKLEAIFNDDVVTTNKEILKQYPAWKKLLPLMSWDDVKNELNAVAIKLKSEVRVLHSGDADITLNTTRLNYLQYEDQPNEIDNGLYTIAIGGNTLARGLTLEGLCVSYFIRSSKTYDTLMQMGRWFGYRDGYVDVCRLYMDDQLVTNFTCIAKATQEMREQFDDMFARGVKPKDFGLKVACLPGQLEPTSRNKYGSTTEGRVTFSMATLQAYSIVADSQTIMNNKSEVETFLSRLGNSTVRSRNGRPMSHMFWNTSAFEVTNFINKFETATAQMNGKLLNAYIAEQNKKGNIIDWTVALVNTNNGNNRKMATLNVNGTPISVGYASRKASLISADGVYNIANAAVIGPEHESIDLSDVQYAQALTHTQQEHAKALAKGKTKSAKTPTSPYGNSSKMQRDKKCGLLLIFPLDLSNGVDDIYTYVLSFPQLDDSTVGYTYRGNKNAFDVK